MLGSTLSIDSIINNFKTKTLDKIQNVLITTNNNTKLELFADNENNTTKPEESTKTGVAATATAATTTAKEAEEKAAQAAKDAGAAQAAKEAGAAQTAASRQRTTAAAEGAASVRAAFNAPTGLSTDDPLVLAILKKVLSEFIGYLKLFFFPFVALMLAMLVTNDMIIYSAPIRVIFFIFTLVLCFLATPVSIILTLFYIIKAAYSYYVNNMTDKPSNNIMPSVFALLPISRTIPTSSLSKLFYYPFTYPKTERCKIKLKNKIKAYEDSLNGSFKNLENLKSITIFKNDLEKINKHFEMLHKIPEAVAVVTTVAATTAPVLATTVPTSTTVPTTTVPTTTPI